ncbi:MAG: dTDP-glucose 4,6-dehydratase [Planctomycetota bacterium]|jgi:dTDP-glucose 4,6-dehydratase
METWLVTGGCGFIGSNFILRTLSRRHDLAIVNLDLLTYAGNLENLDPVRDVDRYRFVRGDVAEASAVEAVMEMGIDRVVHFAAESHVDRSIHDSTPFIRTNVMGTQVLLDAARRHGVKMFLLVSTDEVYGSLDSEAATEESPLRPNSPYAASKTAADLLARAAFRTFEAPVCVTRCSNNFGPFQFPEKLIPLFISNALADESLPVYGDGMNVRDWIYVDDHVDALALVAEKGRPGEVYNVGGGNELPNLEITRMILKALDKPDTLIRYVKDRLGHDRRYAVDASKIATEMGFEPSVSLEKGIARTVDWYRTHDQWWERIKTGAYLEYYEKQYGDTAS